MGPGGAGSSGTPQGSAGEGNFVLNLFPKSKILFLITLIFSGYLDKLQNPKLADPFFEKKIKENLHS